MFQRLQEAKLKLRASKCTLAAPEVSYLGHHVTREGLLPDPTLLQAIREIPMPQNVKEILSFLCLASYYRQYVKGFATITGPLHRLTKKDVVFHWTPKCQEAFLKLKHLLTMAPITAFPDFNMPFRLYTDALTLGLDVLLSQAQNGKEQIICCASRALSQRNYQASKRECLAIAWATARLCPYLMSNKFDIYTDHYALQWLKSMRMGSTLLHRWSAALEEFNFPIYHRPGKDQGHVDGLARLPVEDAPSDEEEAALLVHSLSKKFASRWLGHAFSAKLAPITGPLRKMLALLCLQGHETLCQWTLWALSPLTGGWSTSSLLLIAIQSTRY